MNKPISTLFMLMFVDGKISTGCTDDLDLDKDFPKIKGIKEGLQQYYDIEQTTDLYSLNSIFLRHKLIDKISIIIAPALVGGKETPSLIDGKSLSSIDELKYIKALKLVDVKKLDDSYLHLMYDVINEIIID
jgi:2,5-diamino-6-(ribosylamino)-4(3H)-pyrimidinone 5'-phosphate reductase